MSDTPARDAKLVQLLNDAYAKEKQLEAALQTHLEVTTRDDYAKHLRDHLKETKSHATQVSRRIKQLGGTPEKVQIPGPEGLARAAESVSASAMSTVCAERRSLESGREAYRRSFNTSR